jgi:membrane protease YdiL (CAAX protease family)
MPFATDKIAIITEYALVLVGLVLLWRYVVSPRARRAAGPSPLPKWETGPVEILLFLVLVFFGTYLFAVAGNLVLKRVHLAADETTVVGGAAAQFGMLAGVFAFAAAVPGFRSRAPIGLKRILITGVVTFIVALPILQATTLLWEGLLRLFGIPAEKQDLIRMFAEAKSTGFLAALTLLATVIAPVGEELVFRAGVFRMLCNRAPRFLALSIPAIVFASLHVNWSTGEGFASLAPLVVLAILFSLAYERTGNIGTVIVAHALFNLNTVVLILCGVTK